MGIGGSASAALLGEPIQLIDRARLSRTVHEVTAGGHQTGRMSRRITVSAPGSVLVLWPAALSIRCRKLSG